MRIALGHFDRFAEHAGIDRHADRSPIRAVVCGPEKTSLVDGGAGIIGRHVGGGQAEDGVRRVRSKDDVDDPLFVERATDADEKRIPNVVRSVIVSGAPGAMTS